MIGTPSRPAATPKDAWSREGNGEEVSKIRGPHFRMCPLLGVHFNNPVITNHSPTSYDAEEGCLSLAGRRPCRRYDWVEVKYEDESFHKKKHRFKGFTAEIVQHEMDHLEGILI